MSDGKRQRRPRVTLCAAVTFDGKLDTSEPWPPTLLRAIAPGVGGSLLFEKSMASKIPPEWRRLHTRMIGPAGLRGLPGTLQPSPGEPPVRRWLCLGGPELFRRLLDAGRVDDLCLLVRPQVDGRRGANTLSGPPTPEWFLPSISCRLRRMEVLGGECFLRYTVVRRAAGRGG